MHIDMDSYFASVEQQANPFLIGKPVAVGGKEGSRAVVAAASKEAKAKGVKTAMSQFEAKKFCSDLIFVECDGDKYQFITNEFIQVFKSYSEVVEIFSIDEVFLDLTGYASDYSEAKNICSQIKKDLKIRLGETITCSIGISYNKFLAKLASEIDKPDGITIINRKNRDDYLFHARLTDFCGIGTRIAKRLENMGIFSVRKLRNYPLLALIAEFGKVQGQNLYNMSRGIDHAPVKPDSNREIRKSVSRAYTLDKNTWNKQDVLPVLQHLCINVCRTLRGDKLAARTFVFHFRYADFSGFSERITFKFPMNNELKIFKSAKSILSGLKFRNSVRQIGVYAGNLQQATSQACLFKSEQKYDELIKHLDKINDRYGELTVRPGALAKYSRLRKKVGGFKY